MALMQGRLFDLEDVAVASPPKGQLLKWIGNKQRMAAEIASYFREFSVYHEPFLGSGAVLAALAPKKAFGADSFRPLMEIWKTLKNDPEELKLWYEERWIRMSKGEKISVYEEVKRSYNERPNGADLLFICRTCYGGVVRFRKSDGYISTPCGPHSPIPPAAFARRVDAWRVRVYGAQFREAEYQETMEGARRGDLIYCDPPYAHAQAILYGAQSFSLESLLGEIEKCKSRGVAVALSIDGTKKSGDKLCDLPIPRGLFKREIFISCGRSMLRRFQMNGKSLEGEVVSDRLLLTY